MHPTSALLQFLRIVIFYCSKSTLRHTPFSLFLKNITANEIQLETYSFKSCVQHEWVNIPLIATEAVGTILINFYTGNLGGSSRRRGHKGRPPTRRWRCISFLFAHSLCPVCLFFVFLNKCVFLKHLFFIITTPTVKNVTSPYHSYNFLFTLDFVRFLKK